MSAEAATVQFSIGPARSVYLDLLRGGAAQAVLVGHAYSLAFPSQLIEIQNLGVELFLFMSGFLICISTLQRRDRSGYGFRSYFEDRFFRIFVPFVPALIIIPVIDSLAGTEFGTTSDLRTWVGNLFMLQNHPLLGLAAKVGHLPYLDIDSYGSARQFWSVALEWWLYMLFGAALLTRRNWAAMALLLIVPFFSVVRGGAGDPLGPIWFAGAACGYLHHRLGVVRPAARFWMPLVVILAFAAVARVVFAAFVAPGFSWVPYHFYDLPFSLVAMALLTVGYLAAGPALLRLESFARFIANYSYSLYLIHLSVIVCLQQLSGQEGWLFLLSAIALGNVVGFAFWLTFERWHPEVKTCYRRLAQKQAQRA